MNKDLDERGANSEAAVTAALEQVWFTTAVAMKVCVIGRGWVQTTTGILQHTAVLPRPDEICQPAAMKNPPVQIL